MDSSYILTMTPVYLLGNVHCIGMCGPLTMLIAKHPFSYAYFWGRLFSFFLVGMLAGEMGAYLQLFLQHYYISSITSLLFASAIFLFSLSYFSFFSFPKSKKISYLLSKINQKISLLILKEDFKSVFCFGLATVLLPCGQSLMVFSVSALLGNPYLGALNAFAFALLTTPSLFFAMKASRKLLQFSKQYRVGMGCLLSIVGILALFRGLADLDLMDHLSISHFIVY